METCTLVINGKPVTFCMPPDSPVPRKGPCPGKGKGAGLKEKVKKTLKPKAVPKGTKKTAPAKKPAPKKGTAPAPAESDADREAQVKKMTGKPFHHGYKMAYVIDRLKKLANAMGGNFDRDKMIARVTTKHGTGEMRMTPQGWQVNIQRTNSAPYTRVFKDVESAAAQIESLRFFRPGER